MTNDVSYSEMKKRYKVSELERAKPLSVIEREDALVHRREFQVL